MTLGMGNASAITLNNITDMVNITNNDPMTFFINVNHTVYGGWLYFFLLLVLWVILLFAAQSKRDLLGANLMYSGAAVSLVSFFFRAVYITRSGLVLGLLTDFQMWIFPLVTIIVGVILYATKG